MSRDVLNSLSRRRFLAQSAAGVSLFPLLHGSGLRVFGDDERPAGNPLIWREEDPPNGAPPLDLLTENWITPTERFFVRSHAKAPEINADNHRVIVQGRVNAPRIFSLKELADRFGEHTVTTTLTCAGNRRTEHNAVAKVGGVQWQSGAIGNAKWTGVKLSDVLKAVGPTSEATHIWFDGLDQIKKDDGTINFGGSIPIEKAFDETAGLPGALLVTKMNGQPLTPDHGFPLRMVVPGYIGARSVKWLNKITLANRPSPNHYVAHAYKVVTEDKPLAWAEAGPIYRYALNSVIAHPSCRITDRPMLQLVGYALPYGDGAKIKRVELSTDGGKTWKPAKLRQEARPFCWSTWEILLPQDTASAPIFCRATDTNGHTQPQTMPWNLKGYMFNAWDTLDMSVLK